MARGGRAQGDAGGPSPGSTVLARVTHVAETESDEQTVLDLVLRELTRQLGVPFATVLELDAGGETLRIRAGHGWPAGVVGSDPIDASETTQAGMTLAAGDTIIFDNLAGTSRLSDAALFRRHGVVSSVSALISADDWRYGVLTVHTTSPRRFTAQEAGVVTRIASILGWTLAARRSHRAIRHVREYPAD